MQFDMIFLGMIQIGKPRRHVYMCANKTLTFVDADKGGYIKYYNIILEKDLLSDNGVILADNGKTQQNKDDIHTYLFVFFFSALFWSSPPCSRLS